MSCHIDGVFVVILKRLWQTIIVITQESICKGGRGQFSWWEEFPVWVRFPVTLAFPSGGTIIDYK